MDVQYLYEKWFVRRLVLPEDFLDDSSIDVNLVWDCFFQSCHIWSKRTDSTEISFPFQRPVHPFGRPVLADPSDDVSLVDVCAVSSM